MSLCLVLIGRAASSTSRPFQFTTQDPLAGTALTEDTDVDWPDLEIPHLQEKVAIYDLQDLFDYVQFTPLQSERAQILSSRNLDEGCDPLVWIRSLIPDKRELTFTADRIVKAFTRYLVPYIHSTNNRPDGVVLKAFSTSTLPLPLCILEVHSSPYKNSVSQTAVDVLQQFRLLRCFNHNITECIGFTFPKYGTKSAVTKVRVCVELVELVVHLKPLKLTEVQHEIEQTLEHALRFTCAERMLCFLRLSPSEMHHIGICLGTEVIQQPTKHSILFKSRDDKWFYKFVPQANQRHTVIMVAEATRGALHVTPYYTVMGRLQLFKVPTQLPPLTPDQLKRCIPDFLEKTATALEELHGLGFAHLDVRLPNICFALHDGHYIVKLIDLDRCYPSSVKRGLGYGKAEMYQYPYGAQSVVQLDWKQLGLLAAKAILNQDHEVLVKDMRVAEDPVLSSLIFKGTYFCIHACI